MKRLFIFLFAIIGFVAVKGQIGYQVTLLNTATGEPRANETVSVSLDITDSAGGIIYSGTQNATTNDFGVLSLNVGNANTFDNADWNKLPFFVSATVNGTLIGRSQILSVPVAEYAKRTGQLTVEKLCSRSWATDFYSGYHTYYFSPDGSARETYVWDNDVYTYYYNYYIDSNVVHLIGGEISYVLLYYIPQKDQLVFVRGTY